MCPDCRFVFRVPRDHDGKGIVCPSCRRMLRIPTSTDTPPPLLVPQAKDIHQVMDVTGEAKKSNKRRRSKKSAGGEHSWENSPTPARVRRGTKRKNRWALAGVGLAFLAMVAGLVVLLVGGRPPVTDGASDPTVPPPKPEESLAVAPRSEAAVLGEAEPLTRKFLAATTVEEILPIVRDPAVAEARIRKAHPDGKIAAPGISQFNAGQGMLATGGLYSIPVLTRDQEAKSLAFVQTPEGLKIDWESWVGWSEISWGEFRTTKPVVGQAFRVILSPVDYYNFDFTDDSKWKSYRLESPDKEHAIYGYVEKGSLLDRQVHLDEDKKSSLMMLSLKFPENAISDSQVEIERYICDGWVEGRGTP